MKLFNQTKKRLEFDLAGRTVSVEPWGPVDIPEIYLDTVKRRGTPLDVAPAAPEQRAAARVADQIDSERGDEIAVMRGKLENAEANARVAKEQLERCMVELGESKERNQKSAEEVSSLKDEVDRHKADRAATDDLLASEGTRGTEAIQQLQQLLDSAKASEKAALEAAQVSKRAADDAAKRLVGLEDAGGALRTDLGRVTADRDAAEKLLTEETARANSAEARAVKAEAMLAETGKSDTKAAKTSKGS